MPINELPPHHSNLTEKQQREALTAAYGLPGEAMSPTMELTYEERIKMRRMLDALDQKEAGGLKEFDLNKPPVPRYAHQEYPFLMYNQSTKQTKAAINHAQRQQMLAEGWSEDPVPMEAGEVELSISERMQAEELDRRLKMPREQLEAESSAEHMAAMRAEIEELKARLAGQECEQLAPAEMTAGGESQRRRRKT